MARIKLDVYYDGRCPFCVASRDRLIRVDTANRLNFIDFNQAGALDGVPDRFDSAALATQMHVRMPNGTWRVGYYACAAIVGVLPGLGVVGRLMLLPPVAEIGRRLYQIFAARRYAVSKILGLPAPCDSETACQIPSVAGASH